MSRFRGTQGLECRYMGKVVKLEPALNGGTAASKARARRGKLPFKDIDVGDLLRPNLTEFARKGALMPWRALLLARQMVAQRGAVSLMDAVLGLAEGLPSGAYTGAGIETYLHKVLSEP